MITLHIDEQRDWRGGEQQASYLVRGLLERGHRCILAGRRGSAWLVRHADLDAKCVALPFWGEWDLWSVWRLARLITRHNVDIVHAHTGHGHTFALLACRMAQRGVVVASRRVDFVPARNPLTLWKYRGARKIVAVSRCIADVLRAYGVPEERIAVVYSAQDPARLDMPATPRQDLSIPEDAPLFFCAAALVGHKDHATLLDAFALVQRDLPAARLLLAGTGPLEGRLRERAKRLGLGEELRFLGYRRDVPGLIRAADVFVLSSKMEGLGSAILEAMWIERPVVACAGGGIPEMVRHEMTGLLAPVGDSKALAENMTRMATDPALAEACIKNARNLVEERHSVDAMTQETLQIYGEAAGEECA
jgi:glycosyltransferase involved in cell wall biosynthesis